MDKEERLKWLKQIEKDIYVCSLESTFSDDAKSCAIHSVIEELENQKTGHWTKRDIDFNGRVWHNCSICDGVAMTRADKDDFFNFCPHCGAKMEN